MTIQNQSMYVFSFLSNGYFWYLIGRLIEKRKRDKQMAGLVADRLLAKSNTASNEMQRTTNAQAQIINQQANLVGMSKYLSSMLGSSGSGLGNSDGSSLGQSKVP